MVSRRSPLGVPPYYWEGVALRQRSYLKGITDARKKRKERVSDLVAQGVVHNKSRGRKRSIFTRDARLTVYMLPEIKVMAMELAEIRGAGEAKLISNVVEQVILLWHKFRNDPCLSLVRTEDLQQSDCDIHADADAANLDIIHPKERMEYFLLSFVNSAVVLMEECELPLEALITELREACKQAWRPINQPNQHTKPTQSD